MDGAHILYVLLTTNIGTLALIIRIAMKVERLTYQHDLMWIEFADNHNLKGKARSASAGR